MTVFKTVMPNETQITPSIVCWIPKNNGMLARGSSFFVSAFDSVKAPVAASAPPATKLAVAEKHIVILLGEIPLVLIVPRS